MPLCESHFRPPLHPLYPRQRCEVEESNNVPPVRQELAPGFEKSQLRLPQILPAFQLSMHIRVGLRRKRTTLTWNGELSASILFGFPASLHRWDCTTDVEIGENSRPNGEWASVVDSESSSRRSSCERENEAKLRKHGCSLKGSPNSSSPSYIPQN